MTTKQKFDEDDFGRWMQLIRQLLSAQTKLIEEKLKHIAMIDNGKEPKYFVKDVLDVLAELSK